MNPLYELNPEKSFPPAKKRLPIDSICLYLPILWLRIRSRASKNLTKSMKFAAIDVETANRNSHSAGAIGIVRVEDGKTIETMYSLDLLRKSGADRGERVEGRG